MFYENPARAATVWRRSVAKRQANPFHRSMLVGDKPNWAWMSHETQRWQSAAANYRQAQQ
jgi:hypothetical protein